MELKMDLFTTKLFSFQLYQQQPPDAYINNLEIA